ncbi:MAG: hypothetical protein EPO68_13190 [Planctomycetota bacterium]|nr:MAG: hypothetical protein EPO68_13190 [Planctomycetota bacterium]
MAISRGRSAESKTAKVTKTTRRTETVAVQPEGEGLGFFAGMAIATSVLLLLAFVMIDKYRGGYGEGIFFK